MSLEQGRYIVVEGLEGAGKSTALKTIKSYLSSHVKDLVLTREPGGTRVGEVARELIKEINPEQPLDPRTELLLLYAARIQLMELVIKPSLSKGAWVLADRYELSTFAYQGGGRKMDETFISQLSSFSMQGFKPDLVIFLDVSPKRGLKRAQSRGTTDRIEQEALSFFQDVYHRYHEHLKTMDNVVMIDAGKPLKTVQNLIRNALDNYMTHHADIIRG
ncbi:dTMP kinase [Legionella impletisoli]|uniref:Thymidylate kinase n=1 Tax=Legionella impletisoli TaxID=343510 RepID=A0A917JZ64_9GAMM|nr:dTMP kinase [Legionella impletisoli]GGI91278.1 thymidylate kinase [Legionella impletisoli]